MVFSDLHNLAMVVAMLFIYASIMLVIDLISWLMQNLFNQLHLTIHQNIMCCLSWRINYTTRSRDLGSRHLFKKKLRSTSQHKDICSYKLKYKELLVIGELQLFNFLHRYNIYLVFLHSLLLVNILLN